MNFFFHLWYIIDGPPPPLHPPSSSSTTKQHHHYQPITNTTKASLATSNNTCSSGTHQKKSRTVFTKKQILRLESVFYEKRYLTIKDREELSRSLSLTESQVYKNHVNLNANSTKTHFSCDTS